MTDKERLVEVLKKAPLCNKAFDLQYSDGTIEKVADHILADGWIRPPCKVGDVIYKVMDLESVHRQILEVKVLKITIGDTISIDFKTVKNYRYRYGSCSVDDFGKTIFWSREEAEKALKGDVDK